VAASGCNPVGCGVERSDRPPLGSTLPAYDQPLRPFHVAVGGMLYIWMISPIFYRYTFFRLSPGDLTPPYWINMVAMAISTLAGARLIQNAPEAPFSKFGASVLEGFCHVLLGDGHLVDSDAGSPGNVAIRLPAVSAKTRSPLLGRSCTTSPAKQKPASRAVRFSHLGCTPPARFRWRKRCNKTS